MPSKAAEAKSRSARVGVIDIGSNSIRLVVYNNAGRAPLPVFNEKVLCSLGRGIESTGKLSPDGVNLALTTLERYRIMAEAMGTAQLEVVATAAVRDASNGREFVARVERETGLVVRILPGGDEARLSAEGVLSAFPQADGFVGDLGGGSLELINVRDGEIGERLTVPLGPLRLVDAADGSLRRGRALVQQTLERIDWLAELRGRPFYAVGGAWRTMARLHMEATKYPLHIIHSYVIGSRPAAGLFSGSGPWSPRSFKRRELSRRRVDLLPWAAMVLQCLTEQGQPERLIFSAWGLREGCLYERLPRRIRNRDPLLDAARTMAGETRFGIDPDELFGFLAPVLDFRRAGEDRVRLARAACWMSDFAWAEHPDYRASQAYQRVLLMPIIGTDHPGRAFLAIALGARYGASPGELPDRRAVQLLPPDQVKLAQAIGIALRLAYTLSGGAPKLLGTARLVMTARTVMLDLPSRRRVLINDVVLRRLESLAKNLGLTARLPNEAKKAA